MKKAISFLISTKGDGLNKINIPDNARGFSYVIVHQMSEECTFTKSALRLISRVDVKYIADNGVGLSRSRNIALAHAESDYCYILDDDVSIYESALDELCLLIEKEKIELAAFKVGTPAGPDFKIYPKKRCRLNIVSAARVCSIELFFRTELIKKHGILFNEKFGLGSKYPSGEEYIFVTDCINAKIACDYYPYKFVMHQPESSGDDFYTSHNKILAKREMFRVVTKRNNSLLAIAFFLRKAPFLMRRSALIKFAVIFFGF